MVSQSVRRPAQVARETGFGDQTFQAVDLTDQAVGLNDQAPGEVDYAVQAVESTDQDVGIAGQTGGKAVRAGGRVDLVVEEFPHLVGKTDQAMREVGEYYQ